MRTPRGLRAGGRGPGETHCPPAHCLSVGDALSSWRLTIPVVSGSTGSDPGGLLAASRALSRALPSWIACHVGPQDCGVQMDCHLLARSPAAVQQGRGVHLPGQDVAGSVNPGARETDGAPALWRCPQTFMEHLLSVSHRRPSRGIQSARMDAALSEPTDRHRRRKWRPTQWAVGPGGSGGLLMPPGHIPSWGSPGCPRCSWDPDPQVRSSASGTASWRCRTPWGSGPRFLYQ